MDGLHTRASLCNRKEMRGEREEGRERRRKEGREGGRKGEEGNMRQLRGRGNKGSSTMRDIAYQPVQSSEPEAKRLGSQTLYTTDHTRLSCSLEESVQC